MKRRRMRGYGVVLAVGLVMVVGCGRSESETPSKQAGAESSAAAPATDPFAEEKHSAEQILREMAKAYQHAASYADAGRVRLRGELPGQPLDLEGNYTAAFVRPNKIFLGVGDGNVVCDAQTIYGSSAAAPGCVLAVSAPPELSIEPLFADFVLASSMAQFFTETYTWIPLQAVLLLADDSLTTLLDGATDVRLIDPAKIGDYDCHRVEISRADGKGVFWIDQRTFALRRFEYPVETVKMMLGAQPESKWSLVADFTEAQLDQPVAPEAFQFKVPSEARRVEQLVPKGVELLGKRPAEFAFVGLDGKTVGQASLEGRIAVIDFWSAGEATCRETLARIQQLQEQYRDNDKVRFLPVCVDPANLSNADLEKILEELNVTMPVYRDPEAGAVAAFGSLTPPTTVVLGPKGLVQAYRERMHLLSPPVVESILETLSAGENVFPDGQTAFETMVAEYHRLLDEMVQRDLYISLVALQQAILQSDTAERTEPSVLKLTPLWTSDAIETPGNLLAGPLHDGGACVLVCAGREVVALDANGRVVERHELALPSGESIAFFHMGKTADGPRRFVGFTPGRQQIHWFDENWKRLWSFPSDGHKNPHAGIGDVRLADLDGQNDPEICIGYRGLVGVKAVSMTSEPLWSQRALADVFKMAVGSPGKDQRDLLFATNDQCTLALLDGQGKVAGRLEVPGRLLYWIAAADLDADGRTELCGLSADLEGNNLALGMTPDGQLQWKHDLPRGLPGPMVELVVPAWLRSEGSGQWVLLGADASLHVVSAQGEPIDRFNYGEPIMGVAFAQLGGKPALILSTRGKVAAWAVSWPDNTPR